MDDERVANPNLVDAVPPAGSARRWCGVAIGAGVLAAVGVVLFIVWGRSGQGPGADELYAEIEAAVESGDHETARSLTDELLRRAPDHPGALLYRGHFLKDDGDRAAALEYWSRVPDSPARFGATARYLAGATLLESGRARAAEQKLRRATELNPEYAAPRERLIWLYAVELRGEDLRRELTALRRLRRWSIGEAATFLLAGRPTLPEEQARSHLKQHLAADAQDAVTALALARYELREGRADEALTILGRWTDPAVLDRAAAPLRFELAGMIALAHLEQEHPSRAAAYLEGETLTADTPLAMWRACGVLASGRGAWEQAARAFSHIVSRSPFETDARAALATALERRGAEADARKVFEEVVLLDRLEQLAYKALRSETYSASLVVPTLAEVGDVLHRLERFGDAAEWYGQALSLGGQDAGLIARYQRSAERAAAATVGDSTAVEPLVIRRTVAGELTVGTIPGPDGAAGRSTPAASIRFEDVAESAGIDFQYQNGGGGRKWIIETTGGGVGVLDYDCDGWPDFYFPQGRPLPLDSREHGWFDRFYRNQGDGTFEDVTESAGLGDDGYGQGCAAGDVNNDGFADLFVANVGRNVLYLNNGDGTFREATAEPVSEDEAASSSAAFADFDGDGNADLYVVNYVEDWTRVCRNSRGEFTTCDPQSFPAAQDRLYQNQGDGSFRDITSSSGIEVPHGKGLGIVVADLDADGRADAYVANDGTPNFLFRNESRPGEIAFREMGLLSGSGLSGDGRAQAGMGIACADFDGNLLPDLLVTNFYRETNTLYLNEGDSLFRDATSASGLAAPSLNVLGFGTQAADFDLDGWQDLAVANGDIDDYSAFGRPWKMPTQVFRNLGSARFADVSADCGEYFRIEALGRGMARCDFNADGLPDLVIVHQDRRVAVLANRTTDAGRHVVFRLRGIGASRDAVGAVLTYRSGDGRCSVSLLGGHGFQSSSESCLHVGVGEATALTDVEVRWPGGGRDRWAQLETGTEWLLVEGREPIRLTRASRSGSLR